MLCYFKFSLFLVVSFSFTTSAIEYSNSTALMVPDDNFYGMPVFYKSNIPVHMDKQQMKDHIHRILKPLKKYIIDDDKGDTRLSTRVRRQAPFIGQLPVLIPPPEIVQIEEYKIPFIVAAQIGDYNFRCVQTNGDLVIFNPLLPAANQLRSIPSFTEFQLHPRPGVWWWVICVTFESGGAGMGITGVQKPGGDQGINPNALKSLVG